MARYFCFILSFSLLFSCSPQHDYNHILFSESNIQAKGHIQDCLENGAFEVFNNDTLLEKGKFIRGQKFGKWEHHSNNQVTEIDWKIYERVDDSLSISFPGFWKFIDDPQKLFLADVTPEINNDPNHLFIIHKLDIDNVTMSLEELVGSYYSSISENYEIINKNIFQINDKYYYLTFQGDKDNNKHLIYAFLFRKGDYFYDIGLIHSSDQPSIKEKIFFDIIYSTFLNNERILSPFNELKVISGNFED